LIGPSPKKNKKKKKKKVETMEASPKIEDSIERWSASPNGH
jgi:hypothetical protein